MPNAQYIPSLSAGEAFGTDFRFRLHDKIQTEVFWICQDKIKLQTENPNQSETIGLNRGRARLKAISRE